MEDTRFALAPMDGLIRVMTWVLLPLPVVFVVMALLSPPAGRALLVGMSCFFLLIYATVWLWWRPTWFEVKDGTLSIAWPLRERSFDLSQLASAQIVDSTEFRQRYGRGMRVGAGGLWGGFGLLVCGAETFAMYVSRTDRFAVLRFREGRALMITPEDLERFVEVVRRDAGV